MNQLLPVRNFKRGWSSFLYLIFSIGLASLSFVPIGARAQKTFDFNDPCQKAYQEIIRLRLTAGQVILDAEKKNHPDNLIPYFLENYIDFFVLYFNEDPVEYQARKGKLDIRIRLMNQGPSSSPYFLFTKAILHFQWAAVKIKFGENWDAGWEFRKSFLQISENRNFFSSFKPNAMLLGTMQVAAGTIPSGYKWLSGLLGIRGSIKEGMQTLQQFIGDTDASALLFREEAIFYYLYLQFYIENKRKEVFDFVRDNSLDTKNNHLFTYLAANLAVNAQMSAIAEKIILSRTQDPSYLDMPVWDFEMGTAKLNHLEPDAGDVLSRFIRNFKGKFYVKDVLQKLSWFYYLQGDQGKALHYRQLILKKGNSDTEADMQALKEARNGKWPNKILLKARLLDDGGYFAEALDLLQGKSSSDFTDPDEQVEFAYRLGRIYDDLDRDDEAIGAYLTTLKKGAGLKTYYAARAALQTGYIYEKRGDCSRAVAYYERCIELKDHDYKNSLDQKAKSGISRCKNE
jgi:hypothetical protein